MSAELFRTTNKCNENLLWRQNYCINVLKCGTFDKFCRKQIHTSKKSLFLYII